MATHFQIIKGKSYQFFNTDGSYTEKLKSHLYKNCWYLTLDTAEVYVCLREDQDNTESSLILKKINEIDDLADSKNIAELKESLETLSSQVDDLISSSNNIDGGEIE